MSKSWTHCQQMNCLPAPEATPYMLQKTAHKLCNACGHKGQSQDSLRLQATKDAAHTLLSTVQMMARRKMLGRLLVPRMPLLMHIHEVDRQFSKTQVQAVLIVPILARENMTTTKTQSKTNLTELHVHIDAGMLCCCHYVILCQRLFPAFTPMAAPNPCVMLLTTFEPICWAN